MRLFESVFLQSMDEVNSFTGSGFDDDDFIDDEFGFQEKVSKALKTPFSQVQVLVDDDTQYNPNDYGVDAVEIKEIKNKRFKAKLYDFNGMKFVFLPQSSYYPQMLFFRNEEDGESYADYIDHYYD